MEFLIVCPLALIAGFIDAVAGGGGLVSIPAYLFAGLPVHSAIGTNKLSSTMGTAIATWRYARNGFMVPTFCAAGVACGLAGSAIGSHLALATGDLIFKAIMLAILPVIAFYVMRTKDFSTFAEHPLPTCAAVLVTAAVALAIGVYDGFYGPGTGTFLMLLLTRLARQDLTVAAGTTKAVNLATNASALVVFLANGVVLLPLGLAAGAFNIVGNWLGARHFTSKGSKAVRPIMLLVLALFAVKLVADLVAA
ncbi:sulfite exporter TauE/SafE family protein [Curtanaerobium respiraculi]|uniref:sulfite exporter TauE/SafE family protein n=1 Tax=Curtanaerobium respiraculi TaxID=2949669 RepID=UPI0024B34BF5|nr:TSUP family transporter [Curtanaerobium respiraculi]